MNYFYMTTNCKIRLENVDDEDREIIMNMEGDEDDEEGEEDDEDETNDM